MTRPRNFNAILATAVIGASLALAACGQSEHSTESGAEAGHEAPRSSSAGLPDGHAEAGAKLATAKGEATGQSCVDCHGVDGTHRSIDLPDAGREYPH